FFKVSKGRTFTVVGPMQHRVEVVGTQFNVMARNNTFQVTCFEGKVRVISRTGKSSLLLKGNSSSIVGDSIIHHKNIHQNSSTPSWTAGEFYFESASLQTVMEELMRQYQVRILTNGFDPASRYYTGYFTNKNLKQALEWITMPMNLQYTFINDTTVNIYPMP
ncbi:MAG: FecR family protein, partial [Bacteroidales bacterium]